MKAYQNKKTGVVLMREAYKQLSYSEQMDFVPVNLPDSRRSNNSSDLSSTLISGAIGYATGSAILGGLVGGDLVGGIVGDLLEGGGLMD